MYGTAQLEYRHEYCTCTRACGCTRTSTGTSYGASTVLSTVLGLNYGTCTVQGSNRQLEHIIAEPIPIAKSHCNRLQKSGPATTGTVQVQYKYLC